MFFGHNPSDVTALWKKLLNTHDWGLDIVHFAAVPTGKNIDAFKKYFSHQQPQPLDVCASSNCGRTKEMNMEHCYEACFTNDGHFHNNTCNSYGF